MTRVITEREYWWTDHTELAALYKWLDDGGNAPDVVEYLSKPWHWSPERERMLGKAKTA